MDNMSIARGGRHDHSRSPALDTHDLGEALRITQRLAPYVGAFKIGTA